MRTILLVSLLSAACWAADKPEIAGDWKGTLKTAGPELRLVLHLQKTDGGWTATLDSIDQGAKGIRVSKTTVEDNRLILDVASVKGSYEAEISADGKALNGTWHQPQLDAPLNFVRGTFGKEDMGAEKSATAAPLLGVWEGVIDAGGTKLDVRFTLTKEGDSSIAGKFDSITQGATGMPISGLSLNGADFHFDLRAVGGKYDGKLSADGKALKGTWQQGGGQLPLDWTKK